jgi:hypothetical protein
MQRGRGPLAVTAVIVNVFVVGGLLAGCGGGSSATAGPSPVPLGSSSSVSVGPTPGTDTAARSSPAAATSPPVDPNSDAAILAAARAYVHAFQTSIQSRDLSALDAVATKSCECREGAFRFVDALTRAHQRADVRLASTAERIVSKNSRNAEVTFVLVNAPYSLIDDSGKPVGSGAAGSVPTTLYLERIGSGWRAF